jgi:hypothetical protein
MAGSMTQDDLVEDLKRSVHDTGDFFKGAADADWKRVLQIAATAMQTKRPRTQLGQVLLTAGEARYPLALADFAAFKTYLWAARQLPAWDPCYPGILPRVTAINEGGTWVLAFDGPPTQAHLNAYGSTFKFWYFATHNLGEGTTSTLASVDRPLLLLRAQAELMRELAMRNVNKPVQLRDGLTATPRNSTPAALWQALLKEFEEAK